MSAMTPLVVAIDPGIGIGWEHVFQHGVFHGHMAADKLTRGHSAFISGAE